jgi:hypothetical protein
MEFAGKKRTALFVGVILAACGAGFGSGLLLGRQFPSHRFKRFGESRYLLDATTGKVCDPFKDPKEDPYARYIVNPNTGKTADPFAAYGGHAVTPPPGLVLGPPAAPTYPPACGK